MSRKWSILLVLLLVGLLAFSIYGQDEDEIPVTVKIRNTECSEINISQFLFTKDGNPLGVKRFVPPRPVNRNQGVTFSFEMSAKPTGLRLSGNQNGSDFSYNIDLNWGANEKKISCGLITTKVPYKGGVDYPVARFEWRPKEPKEGEEVRLDASGSVGEVQSYGWDFDDDGDIDQWTQDPVITHYWDKAGQYRVSLTIRDNSGERARTSNKIRVSADAQPTPSGLPRVETFSCREHGYFSQSKQPYRYLENTSTPPHNKCWGHYKVHIYPLEEYIDGPIVVSKITARVTGGISEHRSVEEGFELQVLRNRNQSWERLKSFSAVCASGDKGTLVQWEGTKGDYLEPIAIRITAPARGNSLYVDNSALWIEYYLPR